MGSQLRMHFRPARGANALAKPFPCRFSGERRELVGSTRQIGPPMMAINWILDL